MVAAQLLDAARAVTLMASSRRNDLETGPRSGGPPIAYPDRPLFGAPRRAGLAKTLTRAASSPSAFLIAAFFLAAFTILSSHRATSAGGGLDSLLPHGRAAFGLDARDAAVGGPPSTLVLYDYQGLDDEDADNLRFFLAVGVSPSDGNRYLIVAREQLMPRDDDGGALVGDATAAGGVNGTQQATPLGPDDVPLPLLDSLAPNVEIVLRPNEGCRSAWGVLGWALSAGVFDPDAYTAFILVDSSVRGPFLPAYWPPLVHWSAALLSRLRGTVHMAGATITTDPTRPGPGAPQSALVRPHPRVRPGLVAFDRAALEAIRAGDPDTLRCRDTPEDAMYFNEAGANAAVLHAGLNIDCLMLRFQSKDWLDKSSWGWKYSNSDVDSGPFQVMFVPLRSPALATSRAAVAAHQYSMWTVKALRAAASAEGAAPKPPPAPAGAKKPPTTKRPGVKKITATDKATARLQLDAAAAQAAAMALRQQRQRANTANTEAIEEEMRIEREADLAARLDAEDAGELEAWQRAHQRDDPSNDEDDTVHPGQHAPVLRGGEHSEEHFGGGGGGGGVESDDAPVEAEEQEVEEEGDTGDVLLDFEDNDDGDSEGLHAPQLDSDGSGGGDGDGDEFRAPDLDGDDEGSFRAPDIRASDDYSGADDFEGRGGGGANGGGDDAADEVGDVDEDYNPRSHDEEHNPFGGDEEEEDAGGEVAQRRRSLIDDTPAAEEGLLNDEA